VNYTQEDADNQSKLIGKFFVQFDQTISIIPFMIPKIIYKRNCSNIEKRNIETLLSDLTASSLREKFDSLLADNYSEFTDLIEANKKLSTSLAEMAQIRNTFAHGSYRLGWKNFDGELDKDHFSLRHSKATKNGYEKRSKIHNMEQVEKLIKQLLIMQNAYFKLSTIFMLNNGNQQFLEYIEIFKVDVSKIGKVQFSTIKELK
jgi:hypothetical protein